LVGAEARLIDQFNLSLDHVISRLSPAFDNGMQIATHRFEALSQLFDSYSYTRTLERGFAYITDTDQSLIPSKSKTSPHQKVQIHFYDGAVQAEISS
jgi:exonuclease VII large subunit